MRIRKAYPYLLIAPALLLIAAVSLYPTVYSLWLSLHRSRRGELEFVGLRNYQIILDTDGWQFRNDFWESLHNTLVFGSFFVGITMALAFLLALAFNQRLQGNGLYMVIIFIPWMLSEIVSGIMFRWLFLPQFGLLQNWLAPLLGDVHLLGTPAGAMGVVVGATVWRSLAFASLLVLAGMQTIAGELYDAAAIDGASGWQRFWHITWPLVRPTTMITVLFLSIQAVNAAGMFLSITNGGPGRSTEVLSLFMYREALEFFNFGFAAALSVLMLCLNAVLAFVYLRTMQRP